MPVNLKRKSDENLETAQWAERKNFFHAAASRFYYSLYQKMIYIAMRDGFNPSGIVTHKAFIDTFIRHKAGMLTLEQNAIIGEIHGLRSLRNQIEYKDYWLNDQQHYLAKFKKKYDQVESVIDTLLASP